MNFKTKMLVDAVECVVVCNYICKIDKNKVRETQLHVIMKDYFC